jgi:hypothetical protein
MEVDSGESEDPQSLTEYEKICGYCRSTTESNETLPSNPGKVSCVRDGRESMIKHGSMRWEGANLC